jgi:GH24 family phage-related lysozyme (muramidase)
MKILEYIVALFAGVTPLKANDVPLSLDISQEAIDLIIYYEVGDKSYYEKYLSKPTVPAWQTTASGVTIGIGFDVGHNTKEQVKKALDGVLPENEIKLLQSVSGLKGRSAYYNGLPKVKHTVKVSYAQAEKIFKNDSLPRFTKQTADAFRIKKDRLHPHSNGALTSLVYNRGGSMSNSDSRKEMRNMRYNISINREDKVPADFRSMKRLWSYTKLKGLHLRRDAEAELFQKGLDDAKKR